ncbi:MAG: hypothetical protein EP329_07565 [Deltaproteobacteria bacterium]|nr:MAG: hypothetical protein EP329_07565 [Deltaproteobacteria bacterium]
MSTERAAATFAPLLAEAEAGDVAAMVRVARRYGRGLGVAQSREAAVAWLERAADLGSTVAMDQLALYARDNLGRARWYGRAYRAGAPTGVLLRSLYAAHLAELGLEDVLAEPPKQDYFGVMAASPELAVCKAAAAGRHLKALEKLIASGAGLDALSEDGDGALHKAARLGLGKAVKALVRGGADLELRSNVDLTPLMVACAQRGKKAADIVLALIAAGADVHAYRPADEMTPLKLALDGPEEVLRALLDAGARSNWPPHTEETALEQAHRTGAHAARRVLEAHGITE